MSSVSKVKKLDCTYTNTEKEFEYTLMKFKRENGESNGQFNYSFSLMEAAGVLSVGLCTIDVSSIAIGKLVNGRWRIIWEIYANHLILWICHWKWLISPFCPLMSFIYPQLYSTFIWLAVAISAEVFVGNCFTWMFSNLNGKHNCLCFCLQLGLLSG